LGFEKLQRSVTHDSLRYINILTYLFTYCKSSICCTKLCCDRFVWQYIHWCCMVCRTVEVDGKKLKVQVWDTAGQERYRCITTA